MSFRAQFLGPEGFGTYEIDLDDPVGFRRIQGTASEILVPAFVDIHIHGAFGIDFMSASPDDMLVLSQRLAQFGYDTFVPTTVTATPEQVLSAVRNLPPHCPGFHLEGPFISPLHPGAQPPKAIVDPSIGNDRWDEVLEHPMLRIVTLAPERPGAIDLIRRLRRRSVIISIGHTDATLAQCREALQAGASHMTHTFNAMRPFHHREPGAAGFALLEDRVYAELIYDRAHVCMEAAALLFKAKPADKVIAVSDSTMAAGMPESSKLHMWGQECVVANGQVRLAENGSLAGSASTLLDGFRNLAEDFGFEPAIRACCINPRQAMDLGRPRRYCLFSAQLDLLATLQVNL